MTIKTYRGHSVAEALKQVKDELGPEAVILHTKTIKNRGRLGGAKITEITATTQEVLSRRRDKLSAAIARAPRREAPADSPEPTPVRREDAERTPSAPRPERMTADDRRDLEERLMRALRPTVAVSKQTPESNPIELREPVSPSDPEPEPELERRPFVQPRSEQTPHRAPEAPIRVPAANDVARDLLAAPTPAAAAQVGAIESATDSGLRDEIAVLRQMVGQVLHATRGTGQARMPEALFDCYLSMLNAEVGSELADTIVGAVRDELTPAELTQPEIVRRVVLRHLAAYIEVADEPPPMQRTTDGRPFTLALVGPTGVGKTTTLAKLAATYKLRYGRRIGLVTSDTYRIAAVEQLRTYANIIGMPLQVALTPAEMRDACDRCSDCDAILIDTAGRSPKDATRLEELRGFLEASRPHQTHLVLSSSMSESVMRDAASRFASLRPDHLIFTKLDEAVNFGVLLNIAKAVDARLSFVTTGQEVPDHIEYGNSERLARLILEGEAVR